MSQNDQKPTYKSQQQYSEEAPCWLPGLHCTLTYFEPCCHLTHHLLYSQWSSCSLKMQLYSSGWIDCDNELTTSTPSASDDSCRTKAGRFIWQSLTSICYSTKAAFTDYGSTTNILLQVFFYVYCIFPHTKLLYSHSYFSRNTLWTLTCSLLDSFRMWQTF